MIYGLKNLAYVVGEEKKPIIGAVSLSIDPKITAAFDKTVRGDGQKVKYIKEGYDGSIELAVMPLAFCSEILGYEIDGMTITEKAVSTNRIKTFGLVGETADFCFEFYNCSAGDFSVKTETNGRNVKVQTISIPIYIRKDAIGRIKSITLKGGEKDD